MTGKGKIELSAKQYHALVATSSNVDASNFIMWRDSWKIMGVIVVALGVMATGAWLLITHYVENVTDKKLAAAQIELHFYIDKQYKSSVNSIDKAQVKPLQNSTK